MKKRNFYFFLLVICFLGWGWLLYSLFLAEHFHNQASVCLFRNVTGFPCPSCGTTRSVMAVFEGNIANALLTNPLGLIGAGGLVVAPLWLFYDCITRKDTSFRAFLVFEHYFKKPYVYLPFAVLILLNWIWNFYKDV